MKQNPKKKNPKSQFPKSQVQKSQIPNFKVQTEYLAYRISPIAYRTSRIMRSITHHAICHLLLLILHSVGYNSARNSKFI